MDSPYHYVEDRDPHFIIDPLTRAISTECKKVGLIQGDHNSERFTFEIPMEVEGHTMPACDEIEIHFLNIDQATKEQSAGVYPCMDINTSAEGNITFSWLISHQATKYMGSLNFLVKFKCYDTDKSVKYAWHTAIYKNISISAGLDCGAALVDDYTDVLNAWKRSIEANQIKKLEQTQEGVGDEGENIWTLTFGDGRTSKLKVKNGSRGPTGLVGSIETITGEALHFFVGTKEEYKAVPENILSTGNLFALFTDDDTSADKFAKVIEAPTKDAAGAAVYPTGTFLTLQVDRNQADAPTFELLDLVSNLRCKKTQPQYLYLAEQESGAASYEEVEGQWVICGKTGEYNTGGDIPMYFDYYLIQKINLEG